MKGPGTVITGPASQFVGPVMTVPRLFMKTSLFMTGPGHIHLTGNRLVICLSDHHPYFTKG